eukprot:TRINITY_DN320_c0_g1_i1.p1 TRINITY_DN320_c0_g1~~TRINITY_DN320_c0_g1_i1.p1  ORF type:complete len:263 (+),score=70.39 TRINITY_DN320_c0_g1_i1:113-901(+)
MRSVILMLVVALPMMALAQCPTYTSSDGKYTYDLSGLTLGKTASYNGNEGTTPNKYTFNLCASNTDASHMGTCTAVPQGTFAVFQLTSSNCIPIGQTSQQVISDGQDGPDSGVTITYTNTLAAFKCKDSGNNPTINRVAQIYVKCDASKTTPQVTGITEPPAPSKCHYNIAMSAAAACPKGKGGGGGSDGGITGGDIFLIIFFCGFAVYFAVGVLVKWKVMNASGVEMVPNIDFWRELPGLWIDGVKYAKAKILCQSGYSQV